MPGRMSGKGRQRRSGRGRVSVGSGQLSGRSARVVHTSHLRSDLRWDGSQGSWAEPKPRPRLKLAWLPDFEPALRLRRMTAPWTAGPPLASAGAPLPRLVAVRHFEPNGPPWPRGTRAAAPPHVSGSLPWWAQGQHQVEPDLAEMAARHGCRNDGIDWRAQLVCSNAAAARLT